jgi:hypothetical protein
MLKTHPPMKLSREEELFLRHWIYDEAHYQNEPGRAKRLQVEHRIRPADIAVLIAAAIPDPQAQEDASVSRPAEPPCWPWSHDDFRRRLAEARSILGSRDQT